MKKVADTKTVPSEALHGNWPKLDALPKHPGTQDLLVELSSRLGGIARTGCRWAGSARLRCHGSQDLCMGGMKDGSDPARSSGNSYSPKTDILGRCAGENIGCARGNVGCARGNVGCARGNVGCARGNVGCARGNVGCARENVGCAPGNVGCARGNVGCARGNVGCATVPKVCHARG